MLPMLNRRQHNTRHQGVRCLPFLAGMACCVVLWSGAHLPSRQALALQASFTVYAASETPVSTANATFRSAEPGESNGFGDPWIDFTGTNEDSLEEADFSDAPCVPVYLTDEVANSFAAALRSRKPYGPSFSAPLYGLFEIYRL